MTAYLNEWGTTPKVRLLAVSPDRKQVKVQRSYSKAAGGGLMDPEWVQETRLFSNLSTHMWTYTLTGQPDTSNLPVEELPVYKIRW